VAAWQLISMIPVSQRHVCTPEKLLPAVRVMITSEGVECSDCNPASAELLCGLLHESTDVSAAEGDSSNAVVQDCGDGPAHVCPAGVGIPSPVSSIGSRAQEGTPAAT